MSETIIEIDEDGHVSGPPGVDGVVVARGSALDDVLADVRDEVVRARRKHRAMASYHDGKAVIEEEFDELWTEIKKQRPSRGQLETEAVHVAAMAVRFVLDLLRETDPPLPGGQHVSDASVSPDKAEAI